VHTSSLPPGTHCLAPVDAELLGWTTGFLWKTRNSFCRKCGKYQPSRQHSSTRSEILCTNKWSKPPLRLRDPFTGVRHKILTLWFFCFVLFFVFRGRVSQCSPGCPGTHSVYQAGLELRNPAASAFRVLGLKACATMPSLIDSWTPLFGSTGKESIQVSGPWHRNYRHAQLSQPFFFPFSRQGFYIAPAVLELIL
jgi:hypothetical protein